MSEFSMSSHENVRKNVSKPKSREEKRKTFFLSGKHGTNEFNERWLYVVLEFTIDPLHAFNINKENEKMREFLPESGKYF